MMAPDPYINISVDFPDYTMLTTWNVPSTSSPASTQTTDSSPDRNNIKSSTSPAEGYQAVTVDESQWSGAEFASMLRDQNWGLGDPLVDDIPIIDSTNWNFSLSMLGEYDHNALWQIVYIPED